MLIIQKERLNRLHAGRFIIIPIKEIDIKIIKSLRAVVYILVFILKGLKMHKKVSMVVTLVDL